MKRSYLRATSLLLAISILFPIHTLAGGKHKGKHNSQGVGVGLRGYHNHPVPKHLYAGERRAFRPYYRGEVYYRPHHHDHIAYRFPVYVDGVVVYRPYYYCGDRLFVSAAVPVPRLAFSVEFSSH